MLRVLFSLILLAFAAPCYAAEPGKGVLRPGRFGIRDAGAARQFEVAKDEIGVTKGRGAVQKVPAQADAESVRKVARGVGADLILYERGKARTPQTRRWLTPRVLVKLGPDADVAALAGAAAAIERPAYAPGYVILDAPPGAGNALVFAEWLQTQAGVESAEPLLARMPNKRFIPNDPLFANQTANKGYQWHLQNTGVRGGTAGIDLNVATAWNSYRGTGIRIGVVDDGIEATHPDLAPNVDLVNGRDFNDNDDDPSPGEGDDHGTSAAGLAAARGNNGLGGSGVAPEASLVGLRMLSGPYSDAIEAAALTWKNDLIAVKSNSWGPSDDGETVEGPGILAGAALQDAVTNGRGGKGTLLFWAAGNGGTKDNSNFDGYANSIHVAAIGAVTDDGKQPDYGESGANILVVAPSSGGGQEQTTADRIGLAGYNNGFASENYPSADYTNDFGGTSGAAPLAAGVGALMLQANPNLGWRDVQEILIRTAVKNHATDSGWSNNSAGFHFHHRYGAGLINASAAVAMASTWANLPPMQTIRKTNTTVMPIPQLAKPGALKTFTFSAAENMRVEHVTVSVAIAQPDRGGLEVDLISPHGMTSALAARRIQDSGSDLFWTFSSVRHWGERALGNWTVRVRHSSGINGYVGDVTLTLHGTGVTPTAVPAITKVALTSGNAGVPFSHQVTASNVPSSFAATGLPPGLSINPSTGLISGKATLAGTFKATVSATNAIGTGSAPLTIKMGPDLPILVGEAVEQPGLDWTLDPFAPWNRAVGRIPITHDGQDAARSPNISDWEYSDLSVIVHGPQVVRFWWKVSSERDYDFLSFYLDGEEMAYISGTVPWVQRSFIIPAGPHSLTWSYQKDSIISRGADCGWVDQIALTPYASSAPVFTVDLHPVTVAAGDSTALVSQAEGPGPLTYQWKRNNVDIPSATDRILTIPSVVATDAGTYTCVATNPFGSTTSFPAVLKVPKANPSIADAVDATGLNWALYPGPAWTRVTTATLTRDGIDAARATGIPRGKSATMGASVVGPGRIGFSCRSDGVAGQDRFAFNIDGIEQSLSVTGINAFWKHCSVRIPPGIHTISWTHYSGPRGAGAASRTLIDEVIYIPDPFTAWQAGKFTVAQRADLSFSGPEADPDGDGIINLAEHYFGRDPFVADGAPPVRMVREFGSNYLLFTWDPTANTTSAFGEHSTDRRTWEQITIGRLIVGTEGNLQIIRSNLPFNNPATTGPAHFYRLRLEMNEPFYLYSPPFPGTPP
jgi:subtilisin family serine protease/subtilisin-like proprotein convertase family protein